MEWLEKIIDETLERMGKEEVYAMAAPSSHIPLEMLNTSIEGEDDWKVWKPIPTNLKIEDFKVLEKAIGFKLPESYKHFLSYKYFYELRLINHSIQFPTNLPDQRIESLKEFIIETTEGEKLLKKGYIYFANFNDYGFLCFNTNQTVKDNEYEIVFFDHEDIKIAHHYTENFKNLMESDENHGNRFIEKMNEYYEKRSSPSFLKSFYRYCLAFIDSIKARF